EGDLARRRARDDRHHARAGAAQVRAVGAQGAQGRGLRHRPLAGRRGRGGLMGETEAGAVVTVGRVGEIPPGGVKVVRLDDVPVAVFNLDGGYFAIEDLCTHDGGPLAEGTLEGDVIECPRHGARFNVKTGDVLSLPATSPVPTYTVRVDGDEIKV